MAFVKLQEMLDAAMNQAGEESSMLLGQNLTVAASDILNTDRKSYLCGEDDAIYVVPVESREAYPGRFYLLFSLGDAIVMSSILLGIPPARVQEKRRLSIQEPDDIDAFGEIANQIIGSFNSVFQPKLPDKVHLKLLTPQKYVPEIDTLSDELPFPEASYVMYRAPLEISGYEMGHLDILVPQLLANLFDPQPEVSEEEAAAEAEAEEEPEAPTAPPGVILLLGDEEGRRELLQGLSQSGCNLMDAPLGADLPRLFSYGDDFRVAVVALKGTSDRDLSICKRLVPMMNKLGGAVMLCAPEWTRISVLKALRAGAKDILVSPPWEPEELTSRVSKVFTTYAAS